MSDAHRKRSRAAPSDIDAAVEVFVRGFCFTRSFTHPFVAERMGPVWVMRDGPRKAGGYRNEEWVAHGVSPAEIDPVARRHARGRFVVCAIHALGEPDAPLRSGFKSLDYRLVTSEPLMLHRLARVRRFNSPAEIQRVTTQDLADRLAKLARSRQVLPEHLACDPTDAPLRQYVALVDGEVVGWVRSIVVGAATWCSNMYVKEPLRRRGIARAMLSRMLRDDRAGGARRAVLLASHAGAKLYPVVGYEQIGTLLMFAPRRG